MVYVPGKLPPLKTEDGQAIAAFLENELRQIASKDLDDILALELRPSYTAPLRPREGMIVYADGTSWNPGSGKGPYFYGSDAAWHLLEAKTRSFVLVNATGTQTILNNTFTKVQFPSEASDVDGAFDSATNHRYQPQVPGKYLISSGVTFVLTAATTQTLLSLRKNGNELFRVGENQAANGIPLILNCGVPVDLNGSSDYVEMWAYQLSGATGALGVAAQSVFTWFTALRVG